ncbi:class C sortase [Nocardioides jishulii]|uniref:class C sortase n=1 Tax=Nocardioides jishulii TaxID=2575440 RepID=UPI00158620E7|nr:class C sortase [Nocardioides jishulii]
MSTTHGVPHPPPPRRGRVQDSLFSRLLVAVLILAGSGLLLYPSAASWFTAVNQAAVIEEYHAAVVDADPADLARQLRRAKTYNDALSAGALLDADARKPQGNGVSSDPSLDYDTLLDPTGTGVMGHVRIPSIDVDLPVFHGTGDETLRRGAGHLEGSHLPVGGPGTHAVIAAHRGLPEGQMFDDLGQVEPGDRFSLEVLGEVLTYEVREARVVEPDDTDELRPERGKDLVTLVTCTPLGVNSHRILVTGERVDTPVADTEELRAPVAEAGFPFWAVGAVAALLLAVAYLLVTRRRQHQSG